MKTRFLKHLCIMLTLPAAALGCRFEPEPPDERFAAADLVLSARVTEISSLPDADDWDFVTVDIYSAWKWDARLRDPIDSLTIWNRQSTCGVRFVVGEDYLVYARYSDDLNGFETSLIYGTREARHAAEDYAFMGHTILTFHPEFLRGSSPYGYVSQDLRWFEPVGLTHATEGPWSYHNSLGWLYLTGVESETWYWSQDFGWTWLSPDIYPNVYTDSRGWVYSWGADGGGRRWYYSYDDQEWLSFP